MKRFLGDSDVRGATCFGPCGGLWRAFRFHGRQTDGLVLSNELQAPASIRCHYENVLFELVGHDRDTTGATVAQGGLAPGGCRE